MAITVVQHKSAAGSTSQGVAFTSNVTSGNLIVACVSGGATHTMSTPTDTQSNTYTQAILNNPGATGTPAQCGIYYTKATATGALTVTGSMDSGNVHVHIYEISGADTLEQTGTSSSASNITAATVSTSGATTQANSYVIAFWGANNNAGTWTATGSIISDTESTPAAGTVTSAFSEDAVVSTTGTKTATATISAGDHLTGVIATFYAGTVSTVKQYLGLLGVGS